MALLITGGAGTLAGDVVDYWQNYSITEELILIDNFLQSSLKKEEITSAHISIVDADCTDLQKMTELFTKYKPRAVLHFASTMESSTSGFRSNVKSLLVTLRASEAIAYPTIFFPQSFLTRNCQLPITDTSPLQPESGDYPLFKSLCERYLESYQGKSVVGIISTTLSPRLSIGPIPAFAKRLLGDQPISISATSRDYISPDAVVKAILLTLEDSFAIKQVVIASGQSKSTQEIYRLVSAKLKIERNPEPGVTSPGAGDPPEISLIPSDALLPAGWDPLENLNAALGNCIDRVRTSTTSVRQHHIK
jgi:nucleoside-diphosphate-sugar epimerase